MNSQDRLLELSDLYDEYQPVWRKINKVYYKGVTTVMEGMGITDTMLVSMVVRRHLPVSLRQVVFQ